MKAERYYVVYIYPVEPNLCGIHIVTDSILGEYMVDAKTSPFCKGAEVLKIEDLPRHMAAHVGGCFCFALIYLG